MIKKILSTSLLGCVLSCSVYAGAMGETRMAPAVSPFYLGAYGGYGALNGGNGSSGNFIQGRLSLGVYFLDNLTWRVGTELGVQSGNTMSLQTNAETLVATDGYPVNATLQPLADWLLTVRGQLNESTALFIKGGIAYREMQLVDSFALQGDVRKVSGEFQAGIGFQVSRHASINLFYQGIYATTSAGATVNSNGEVTISSIPTQQAGFLGVDYAL